MTDEKIIDENINNLVVGKNSRWRVETGDLAELMESIKQHGILQPIVARVEDKVIICGNRRFMACKKLGLEIIPVRYLKDIDEKKLMLLNLTENMQRKDVSSIEIGREVYNMIHNKDWKISLSEIAVSLGVSQNRIRTCLAAFTSLPEEFRKDVIHQTSAGERRLGTLPENVVQAILNLNSNISRIKRGIKINNADLTYLLTVAREEGLTVSQISLLQHMLAANIPMRKAVKNLDNYEILRVNLIVLKTELDRVMGIEGIRHKAALINKIVKDKYKDLIY